MDDNNIKYGRPSSLRSNKKLKPGRKKSRRTKKIKTNKSVSKNRIRSGVKKKRRFSKNKFGTGSETETGHKKLVKFNKLTDEDAVKFALLKEAIDKEEELIDAHKDQKEFVKDMERRKKRLEKLKKYYKHMTDELGKVNKERKKKWEHILLDLKIAYDKSINLVIYKMINEFEHVGCNLPSAVKKCEYTIPTVKGDNIVNIEIINGEDIEILADTKRLEKYIKMNVDKSLILVKFFSLIKAFSDDIKSLFTSRDKKATQADINDLIQEYSQLFDSEMEKLNAMVYDIEIGKKYNEYQLLEKDKMKIMDLLITAINSALFTTRGNLLANSFGEGNGQTDTDKKTDLDNFKEVLKKLIEQNTRYTSDFTSIKEMIEKDYYPYLYDDRIEILEKILKVHKKQKAEQSNNSFGNNKASTAFKKIAENTGEAVGGAGRDAVNLIKENIGIKEVDVQKLLDDDIKYIEKLVVFLNGKKPKPSEEILHLYNLTIILSKSIVEDKKISVKDNAKDVSDYNKLENFKNVTINSEDGDNSKDIHDRLKLLTKILNTSSEVMHMVIRNSANNLNSIEKVNILTFVVRHVIDITSMVSASLEDASTKLRKTEESVSAIKNIDKIIKKAKDISSIAGVIYEDVLKNQDDTVQGKNPHYIMKNHNDFIKLVKEFENKVGIMYSEKTPEYGKKIKDQFIALVIEEFKDYNIKFDGNIFVIASNTSNSFGSSEITPIKDVDGQEYDEIRTYLDQNATTNKVMLLNKTLELLTSIKDSDYEDLKIIVDRNVYELHKSSETAKSTENEYRYYIRTSIIATTIEDKLIHFMDNMYNKNITKLYRDIEDFNTSKQDENNAQ